MKAVLISFLFVATAACGAYRFPGAGTPVAGTGTVSGQVSAVPCFPIEPAPAQAGVVQPPSCAGRPVSGAVIEFSGNGAVVGTKTDPKGFYSVTLASGTWKVSLQKFMRIISGPPVVTVTTGSKVVANYLVDSGIRVAVSKEPSTNPLPPSGGSAAGGA